MIKTMQIFSIDPIQEEPMEIKRERLRKELFSKKRNNRIVEVFKK